MDPPLHPGTREPVTPDDLAPLFPMELIMQEVSTEREIDIPEPVREVYKLWRPAPLFREFIGAALSRSEGRNPHLPEFDSESLTA